MSVLFYHKTAESSMAPVVIRYISIFLSTAFWKSFTYVAWDCSQISFSTALLWITITMWFPTKVKPVLAVNPRVWHGDHFMQVDHLIQVLQNRSIVKKYHFMPHVNIWCTKFAHKYYWCWFLGINMDKMYLKTCFKFYLSGSGFRVKGGYMTA